MNSPRKVQELETPHTSGGWHMAEKKNGLESLSPETLDSFSSSGARLPPPAPRPHGGWEVYCKGMGDSEKPWT